MKKYRYRVKTSYGAYKRYIRDFKERGLYVDPSEILTKKQFDYEYAQYKARGKTNITRELAYSIPSAQYSRYKQIIESYKKRGYKVDETLYNENLSKQMDYSDFKEMFKEFQKIRSSRKPENVILKRITKSVAQEMAEGTLLFTPSFAKEYAEIMVEQFSKTNPELYTKYSKGKRVPLPSISGETEYKELFVKSRFERDIMAGEFKGANLFEAYINTHNGWYLDEQGGKHIKKHVREQFEAIY